ncbi:site-specific integrase [Pseudomonas fulva]|uniref:site-specific integrase n=1 Tax=Pseudomonas fulva TaxID=47880 RepID=UPI00201E084D|nr:site-specific integrase [Pseudomonas fulva]UQY33057.1 site-specific integrase [Pseudomonas fulva]
MSSDFKVRRRVKKVTLFSHYSLNRLAVKEADNLTFLYWPNGEPCHLANLYMISLRNRISMGRKTGLSRRGKGGGTIGGYAHKISRLLNFTFSLDINLTDLNDGLFCDFVDELRIEKNKLYPSELARNEDTLHDICSACLYFLEFIGSLFDDDKFVAKNGIIKAYQEKVKSPAGYDTYVWRHHTFSSGEAGESRKPISQHTVKDLREAANKFPKSDHIAARTQLILSMLENLGCRRGELAEILLESVLEAMAMKFPSLKLITLKRGRPHLRTVPVTRMLLNEIYNYIELYRVDIIDRCLGGKDHGFLLVAETTGRPYSPDSITNEIRLLRKNANISEPATAHLFRHAFITNLFVLMIERHRLRDQASFKNQFISDTFFKHQILQLTGQKTLKALDTYINIAFARVNNYTASVSAADLLRIHRQFDDYFDRLLSDYTEGRISKEKFHRALATLRAARDSDYQGAEELETRFRDGISDTLFPS